MLSWSNFEQTSTNLTSDFEDLCRLYFKIRFINDISVILGKKVNNAGIETDPVLIDGTRIGFQAKYFTDKISYSDICDSCNKTIKYYNSKVDKVIIFSNKDINLSTKSLKDAIIRLEAHNITLELCCNQNILDPINADEKYAKIKALFFNKQSFTLDWFSDNLSRSLIELEPRYNPNFNVKNEDLHNHFGIIYQDEFVATYLQNIIKQAKNDLKEIVGFKDIIKDVLKIISGLYIPDRRNYSKIFEWYELFNSTTELLNAITNELEEKYNASYNNEIKLSEKESKALFTDLDNCRRLLGIVENFDFSQDKFLKNLKSHIFIVEGDAGTGKSHLLGYESNIHGTSYKCRTVLLLGQKFIFDSTPQDQIKKILNLHCSFEDFLLACEARGEVDGGVTIIMIDAVNECSKSNIWKHFLGDIINQISSLNFVKLVLSIRTTYINDVFSEQIVTNIKNETIPHITVVGFRNNIIEAVPAFFNYYGIPLTASAYLETEFENPLFLKTYCESYSNGIEIGSRGIYALYEAFIEKEEAKIREKHNILTPIKYGKNIIGAIGKYLYEHSSMYIPLDALYENFNDQPNYEIFITELLNAKVLLQYKYDSGDIVHINYEKFTDYIVAKHILNSSDSFDILCEKVKKEMLVPNEWGRLDTPYLAGRFAALSLLAREKYHKELITCIDILPETDSTGLYLASDIVTEYLDSYRFRADEDIDLFDFKKEVVPHIKSKNNIDKFWDALISLAGRNCPLNANYITSILMPMPLKDRDYQWTLYLNQEYSEGSRIYNIIHYFLDLNIEILTRTDRILYSQLLTWFLSASNRQLRDLSSRALIRVLYNDVPAWIELLTIFKGVNDPYIISRLYGCIYGALLITYTDNIRKNQLSDLCNYIYKTIFDQYIVYPDILLRDYALNIIEFCASKKIELNFDIQYCRPPYKSYPIPNVDIKDLLPLYPKDAGNEGYGTRAIMNSMMPNYDLGEFSVAYMYGDFGGYIFQYALEQFIGVDVKAVFYYAFYYIIKNLEYDSNLFSDFDHLVGYGRMRNYARVERIGKKYEWIALYHTLALVSDTHCIKYFDESTSPYKGPWEPYIRDFDPTLTIFSNERQYKNYSFHLNRPIYDKWDLTNDKWAHIDDAFNFLDNVSLTDNNNEKWYALYFNISDATGNDYSKPRQTVWLRSTACLIKKSEQEYFIDKIKDKNFYGRWLHAAEIDSSYVVFAREHTWATAYQNGYDNLSFKDAEIKTGERVLTRQFPVYKLPSEEDLADLNQYLISIRERLEKRDITEDINTTIGHLLPCSQEYSWEEEYDCSKKESINIMMPHKFLVDTLNLKQTKDGVWENENEVVCADFKLFKGSNVDGLYIRESYLRQLLGDNYTMVWICLGEKWHLHGERSKQVWSELSSLIYFDNEGKLKETRNINHRASEH